MPAASGWSGVFMAARRLHEHFVFDLGIVVTVSTIAMLVLIALGVLMGLPQAAQQPVGLAQGRRLVPAAAGDPEPADRPPDGVRHHLRRRAASRRSRPRQR